MGKKSNHKWVIHPKTGWKVVEGEISTYKRWTLPPEEQKPDEHSQYGYYPNGKPKDRPEEKDQVQKDKEQIHEILDGASDGVEKLNGKRPQNITIQKQAERVSRGLMMGNSLPEIAKKEGVHLNTIRKRIASNPEAYHNAADRLMTDNIWLMQQVQDRLMELLPMMSPKELIAMDHVLTNKQDRLRHLKQKGISKAQMLVQLCRDKGWKKSDLLQMAREGKVPDGLTRGDMQRLSVIFRTGFDRDVEEAQLEEGVKEYQENLGKEGEVIDVQAE